MTTGTAAMARGTEPLHTVSGPAALGSFEFATAAVPAARAYELLDAYHELGGRLLDTAPTYGPGPDGSFGAERLIATWLRTTGADGVHVISKAGLDPNRPDRGDLQPETILASARRSAEIIGAPIALVLHRDDPQVPIPEIAEAADRAVRERTASRVGASNWRTGRLAAWADRARVAHLTCPEITAPLWSLAPRTHPIAEPWLIEADAAHLAFAARTAMTITPYRTLAAGFLAARHSGRHAAHHGAAYDTPDNRARRDRLRRAAADLGMSPTGLALAYLSAAAPGVVPVIGPRSLGQLREAMAGAAAADRVTAQVAAYLATGS